MHDRDIYNILKAEFAEFEWTNKKNTVMRISFS